LGIFTAPSRRVAPLTDTQLPRVFEMRIAGSSYGLGVTERAWQWLTSPSERHTMSLRTQGEHTPAHGSTCCPKPRPPRSATYGRFDTESRQRFPFVPLAMLPAPRSGTDARSRRSRTLQPLRGGAHPRSRCPLCVSCRFPEAVLPFVHATRRHLVAPDGEMWSYAHGSSAASRCMRSVASALCTPHRPSAGIGASPVPSLLPAYACVACNVMHVRRMCGYPCVRWVQSQVSAWAAPFPFYPSEVAVVSTR